MIIYTGHERGCSRHLFGCPAGGRTLDVGRLNPERPYGPLWRSTPYSVERPRVQVLRERRGPRRSIGSSSCLLLLSNETSDVVIVRTLCPLNHSGAAPSRLHNCPYLRLNWTHRRGAARWQRLGRQGPICKDRRGHWRVVEREQGSDTNLARDDGVSEFEPAERPTRVFAFDRTRWIWPIDYYAEPAFNPSPFACSRYG